MRKFVLDLGGSIVAPRESDPIFLRRIRKLLIELSKKNKFFVVIGGGYLCRDFNERARAVRELNAAELDWLGIKATQLNAFFFATILGEAACQQIFTDPTKLPVTDKNIIVGGGWRPGNSTDFVAVKLAVEQKVSPVVVLTNVDYVYDKDPNKFDDARPIKTMTWTQLKKIVGSKWIPGAKTPLDPKACDLAEQAGLQVVFMNGNNLLNFKNFIQGKKFAGTIIN